jgi:TonB family protein
VWAPEVTDELRKLMIGVTERGTARSAFLGRGGKPLLGPIQVSGKTGSLNGTNPAGSYSWFIGVAPADEPRLAIAVVVVNQPPSHTSASKIAASTLHAVFCDEGACDVSGVERLHARARHRDASARAEIEAAMAERAAAEAAVRAAAEARRRELARLHEVDELDEVPRPIGFEGIDFPRYLMNRRVRGKIVLSVSLDTEGDVTHVEVASSTVGHLDEFIVAEVAGWKFTPPTRGGRPVNARADLPLQIRIR